MATTVSLWHGLIGRPRELHPLLAPHELEAPGIAGGYYTLATVDYADDRFVLAHNGAEGIVFVIGRRPAPPAPDRRAVRTVPG